MKKKIIIDLDIVTVSIWDKKGKQVETAREFIEKVENKEFNVGTPFLLIEVVMKWKHETLKNSIKEFYVKNSDRLFTDTEIKEKCEDLDIDYNHALNELENAGIKKEDAALVLITSLFSFECLVTFNRIHLKNKKEEANRILKEWKLPTIQILGPEEL